MLEYMVTEISVSFHLVFHALYKGLMSDYYLHIFSMRFREF